MATQAVGRVRSQLVNMFIVCLYYQVDILGGDANASSYRYYRTQGVKNFKMGNFMLAYQRVRDAYQNWLKRMILERAHLVETRRWLEVQFLQQQFVINCKVTQEEYLEAVKKEQDPADCLLSLVLSWGHGKGDASLLLLVTSALTTLETNHLTTQ